MKQNDLFNPIEKQDSLEVFNYQIRAFNKCSLAAISKQTLPGKGNMDTRIMFIALSP